MKFLLALALGSLLASAASAAELRVYTAKKIITMEPALAEATAVAAPAPRWNSWGPRAG